MGTDRKAQQRNKGMAEKKNTVFSLNPLYQIEEDYWKISFSKSSGMNNLAIFSPKCAEHYQEHKMTQHFFIAVLHIITCLAWEESYIITINPCSLLLSWHRHDGLNGRTQYDSASLVEQLTGTGHSCPPSVASPTLLQLVVW